MKCVSVNIACVSFAGSFIGSCVIVNQRYNNSRTRNMHVCTEVNASNRLDSYTMAD